MTPAPDAVSGQINASKVTTGLLKGAPQGSILGPFIFNVFLKDLLHQMGCLENCDLYNYADDNTAGVCGKTPEDSEICSRLEIVVASLLHWFDLNFMQANPSKFQFMMFGKKTDDYSIKLARDVTLVSCPAVQLLGITLDCTLTFTDHILNLCKKAGRSVNALARLSKDLDAKSKLVLFQSFVMSHFNYCPCVWHFGRRADVRKIENVQFRCLKYIYNDFTSTYGELRKRAERPIMYVQRLRAISVQGVF